MEKIKGKKLKFISLIKRDGSGTVTIGSNWNVDMSIPKVDEMSYEDESDFELHILSLTERTFIAHGFNSFVVRLKRDKRPIGKRKHKKLSLTDTRIYQLSNKIK